MIKIASAVRIIILFFIQIFAIQPAFSSSPVEVNIGTTRIILPAPHGFSDPSGLSKNMEFAAEAMTPPSNRLLKFFIPDKDLGKISSDKSPTLNRYFVVQTMRKLDSANVSDSDFFKLRESLKSQQKNLFDQSQIKIKNNADIASKKIGEKFGDPTFLLKIGEVLPLGVFHVTNSSLGFSAITKNSFVVNGVSKETPIVMSAIISLLKGKLIYLYTYSVFKSNADTDWTQSASRHWFASISSSN